MALQTAVAWQYGTTDRDRNWDNLTEEPQAVSVWAYARRSLAKNSGGNDTNNGIIRVCSMISRRGDPT